MGQIALTIAPESAAMLRRLGCIARQGGHPAKPRWIDPGFTWAGLHVVKTERRPGDNTVSTTTIESSQEFGNYQSTCEQANERHSNCSGGELSKAAVV